MTLGQNSPGKDLRTRYLWLAAAFIFGLLVLAVRLYRLQITQHDEFSAKSVQNFVKEVRLRADRGSIRDARGEVLVQNRPSFDIFVTPAFCQGCSDQVLPQLAQWFLWDPAQLQAVATQVKLAKRTAPFQPIPVRIDISRDELDLVSAHLVELPGVDVEPVQHRAYKEGSVLSHVLGYMNEITQEELDRLNANGASYALGDYIGRRGIERYFESTLRGVDGYRKEVVNARGETIPELNKLFLGGEQVVEPKPGNNIVLSIDMRLQREAEAAFPGLAGAVVAVDPRTGFIKAIVSRPGFDPNVLTGRVTPAEMAKLSQDRMQPMIFRPAAQHYSPGSTFKPITSLAALKAGVITPNTTINCPGDYRLGNHAWRCDSHHGPVALHTALARSCDVYYYRVGDLLGIDAIAEMGREFGFGQETGIGVVAEVKGIMPDTAYHDRVTPGGYTKGLALNTAIGQGDDNVTPLQLAMAYSALANGGTLYTPQLVQRIENADGQVVQEFAPKVTRKVAISPENRRVIVDALKAVVNEPGGTAYASRLPDMVMAGKTGTAQVVRLGAVRLKAHQIDYWSRDNAWFASFAPADNPELVVIVLNEHAGFGATGAAPTAARIMKKWFELKKEDADAAKATATPQPLQLPSPADEGPAHGHDVPSQTSAPANGAEMPGVPNANEQRRTLARAAPALGR